MTDLRRALKNLSAVRIARNVYAYASNDEGPTLWYGVTSDDLRDYGRRLKRDEHDAYSLWCAATIADRLGSCYDYDPRPTLRRRLERA